MATPTSIRLGEPLERRVRAVAYLERASFSLTLRRLVERGLDTRPADVAGVIDPDEVERVAAVAREMLSEHRVR